MLYCFEANLWRHDDNDKVLVASHTHNHETLSASVNGLEKCLQEICLTQFKYIPKSKAKKYTDWFKPVDCHYYSDKANAVYDVITTINNTTNYSIEFQLFSLEFNEDDITSTEDFSDDIYYAEAEPETTEEDT